MSIIQSDLLLGQEGGAGYAISRSLRFNSSDSGFCARTMSSASSTYTLSMWVKRSTITSNYKYLFSSGNAGIAFYSGTDQFYIFDGSTVHATTGVYRDTSAWYHILLSVSSNTGAAYINGTQVLSGKNTASLSTTANATNIGRYYNSGSGDFYFDGYIADVYLIDGQALTPSSFTEVSATTGQLVPKQYTGSFGTNGFWLKFSDNSAATATTLGKDYSGNNNNWSPSNLSVTAGAGNDSLVDTPSSAGTDTGLGGQVTGNYCTLNPLVTSTSSSLSNGNLDLVKTGNSYTTTYGTIKFPSSGKWYFEVIAANNANIIGIDSTTANANIYPDTAGSYGYYGNGNKIYGPGGIQAAYGASFTTGDVIGVALDITAGTLVFYKNGVSQGTAFTGLSGEYFPAVHSYTSGTTTTANFGQRPFAFPVSGFKALCDTNLPAPVVAKSSDYFQTVLWTGNSSTQTVSGLSFSPDLVWLKCRNDAYGHRLLDTVRGATIGLASQSTAAESTESTGLTAFNSDGFTLGSNVTYNESAKTYVGWAFDAGTTTTTNTAGSITSQVRANASAGFSVVSWTAPGSVSTVGHGLNITPQFIISRNRGGGNWAIYHTSQGAGYYFEFSTQAAILSSGPYNSTAPTSSVFTTGASSWWGSGGMIAYCFAPVAGYSSFGSYTGNGSADGPFVFTGMRPRWVMLKQSSGSGTGWQIHDTSRNTYNVMNNRLQPNNSDAESTYTTSDFLSNGFKLRDADPSWNSSGATYIYFAVAESPFAYSRAR